MILVYGGIICILFLIVFAVYCACRAAGGFEREKAVRKKDEFVGGLCSRCQTGAECYRLDAHDEMCPYIDSYNGGSCKFFRPITKNGKASETK